MDIEIYQNLWCKESLYICPSWANFRDVISSYESFEHMELCKNYNTSVYNYTNLPLDRTCNNEIHTIFGRKIKKIMEQKSKVSIIVGCYNVSKWLRMGRLNDIYNQTYRNWELILVDDGSTDETPTLLDTEAEKDSRIRVIHKENGGLGSARNVGLDVASGDYIWSFDVDDRVEPNCIEYCVTTAEENDYDVVMFGFYVETPSLGTKEVVRLTETVINSNTELSRVYLDRILFVPNGNGFFWNKFYKRSFLEKYKLRFENQRIQQDEVFNLKVYHYLDKAYVSSDVLYTYYIYNNGNTRSRFIPNRFDIYKSVRHHFDELKKYWNLKDKRLDDYLNKRFYQSVMACLLFNLTHPKSTFTKQQAKVEINRVMDDPLTIEAFDYARKNITGIEQRLYRKACKSKSLLQIRILTGMFSSLRKVHNLLKR